MLRLLILGGTGEGAELAAKVGTIQGIEAIASLAGRTHSPTIPPGNYRVGGFGGVGGLVDYLHRRQIDVLIDATHPFASQISWNAAEAATSLGIPRLMLVRTPWQQVNGDNWLEVADTTTAAMSLENQAQRVFLTIGRQEISAFAQVKNIWFLMRMIDPPTPDTVIPQGMVLCDRGPFTIDNEREIFLHHQIDTIVSKNSGGDATYAKIIAARELGVKVVMIQRPTMPPGAQVPDVESAVTWLIKRFNLVVE